MLKLITTTTLMFTLLSFPVYTQFNKAFFKKYTRDVSVDECLSSFLKGKKLVNFKNQILNMQKDINSNVRKNPTLYLMEKSNGYSGKLSNETLGIGSFDIPYMKKDFEGTAKIFLDNGLNIYLKVNNSAKLSLVGGFGRVNKSGPCEPYNS